MSQLPLPNHLNPTQPNRVPPPTSGGGGRVAGMASRLFEAASEEGPSCGWSENGSNFVVHSISLFEELILTPRFGHGNYSSFVRQMNQYGFHKDRAAVGRIEFRHPNFHRDRPHCLPLITRRPSPPSKVCTFLGIFFILLHSFSLSTCQQDH